MIELEALDVPTNEQDVLAILASRSDAEWVASDQGGASSTIEHVPSLACLRSNPTCATCLLVEDGTRSVGLLHGTSVKFFIDVFPESADGFSGSFCRSQD